MIIQTPLRLSEHRSVATEFRPRLRYIDHFSSSLAFCPSSSQGNAVLPVTSCVMRHSPELDLSKAGHSVLLGFPVLEQFGAKEVPQQSARVWDQQEAIAQNGVDCLLQSRVVN
jgi:hypothetical protein